jgi:hypothetical protein
VNMLQFGFTAEHVTSAALRLFGRSDEADKEYGPADRLFSDVPR